MLESNNNNAIGFTMRRLMSVLPLLTLFSLPQIGLGHDDHSHGYTWPKGKKAAVVLTYDDATDTQLDIALPQLNAQDFNATFYVSIARDSFTKRIDEWKTAATQGHELGNHTLYHPCQKSKPNRDWVEAHHDLDKYSLGRMLDEIAMTETVLQLIDGKTERSFAYPCGELEAGGESYVEGLKSISWAARNADATGLNDANSFDRHLIAAWDASGKTGEQMIRAVEKSLADNSFIVLVFHGVGGDFLEVSAEAHQQLLSYLKANESLYWVDSMENVLRYVDGKQHSASH